MQCACGCGQELAPGSKWTYKRGHKSNPPKPAEPSDFSGFENTTYEQVDSEPMSLDDAALNTPDDPEPADEPEESERAVPIVRITKRVKDDIEGKVGLLLGMLVMPIALRDPVCGGALSDNAENIASKMVPLVCKSPELVQWFTKRGNFVLWLDLFMAFMPVFQTVAQHHLMNPNKGQANYDAQAPDFSGYSVD